MPSMEGIHSLATNRKPFSTDMLIRSSSLFTNDNLTVSFTRSFCWNLLQVFYQFSSWCQPDRIQPHHHLRNGTKTHFSTASQSGNGGHLPHPIWSLPFLHVCETDLFCENLLSKTIHTTNFSKLAENISNWSVTLKIASEKLTLEMRNVRTIKLTTGTLNLCSGTIPSLPTWTHFTNDRNFHFSLVNNFTMLENRRHVEKCIHYNGMTQHTLHTHFLPTLLHLKINQFGNSGRMNRSPPKRKRTPRLAHCHARAQVVDVECDWGLPTFVFFF